MRDSSEAPSVFSLMEQVRDLVNVGSRQSALMSDPGSWLQLCSAMDTVGDTELAIQSYGAAEHEPTLGTRYLEMYGFLQALTVQQDSVHNMCRVLGVQIRKQDYPELNEIRRVRIGAAGHPTNMRTSDGPSSQFVVRVSIGPHGFLLLSIRDNGELQATPVDTESLRTKQRLAIQEVLDSVVRLLRADGHPAP